MTTKKEKQAFYKLTFWINETQYHQLVKQTQGRDVSAYARRQLFHTKRKEINLGREDAARILALLGKTRQHSNMNQIAHAIHCGTVSFSDQTETAILEATVDIKKIRQILITMASKKI
ncbi:hypothetical protein [Agarilytica rhodophyticola]|uniref:hypothetical protein n=1 Tax=Agarilytica rhodophyticola TaxID=1737490 RepID=UPI000B3478E5|nr:hypothetical protein [Agarilytica rhodophyticola]